MLSTVISINKNLNISPTPIFSSICVPRLPPHQLVSSKQCVCCGRAEHSHISVTSTPLGPHLGPVTACSGLSASVSFVKCGCRLLHFLMWNSWQVITAKVKSWALTTAKTQTSAREIFGSALKCFDKVMVKQSFFADKKSQVYAVHCSVSIVFPLEYINDQIMNSACFQRFSCDGYKYVRCPFSEITSHCIFRPSSLPSFLSSNVREAGSNGARLQRVHTACACIFFFSCTEISLQLSVILAQKKKSPHIWPIPIHAHTIFSPLFTPQGVSVCAGARVNLALYTAA